MSFLKSLGRNRAGVSITTHNDKKPNIRLFEPCHPEGNKWLLGKEKIVSTHPVRNHGIFLFRTGPHCLKITSKSLILQGFSLKLKFEFLDPNLPLFIRIVMSVQTKKFCLLAKIQMRFVLVIFKYCIIDMKGYFTFFQKAQWYVPTSLNMSDCGQ